MAKVLLEGHISKEQHGFLKELAQTIHDESIRLGIEYINADDDRVRQSILEIVSRSNELSKWLDVLTETGGYQRLQAYLNERKINRVVLGGGKK
jgi:hypothetical protein